VNDDVVVRERETAWSTAPIVCFVGSETGGMTTHF
jgi:hypothetical protein